MKYVIFALVLVASNVWAKGSSYPTEPYMLSGGAKPCLIKVVGTTYINANTLTKIVPSTSRQCEGFPIKCTETPAIYYFNGRDHSTTVLVGANDREKEIERVVAEIERKCK